MNRLVALPCFLPLVMLSIGCDSASDSGVRESELEEPLESHTFVADLDGEAFAAHRIEILKVGEMVTFSVTDTVHGQMIGLTVNDSFEGEIETGTVTAHLSTISQGGDLETHEAVSGRVSVGRMTSDRVEGTYSLVMTPVHGPQASKREAYEIVGSFVAFTSQIVDVGLLDETGYMTCTLWLPTILEWGTRGGGLYLSTPQWGGDGRVHAFALQGQTFGPWQVRGVHGVEETVYYGPEDDPVDVSMTIYFGAADLRVGKTYTTRSEDAVVSFWLRVQNSSVTVDMEADRSRGKGHVFLNSLGYSPENNVTAFGSFSAIMEDDSGARSGCLQGTFVSGINFLRQ